MFVKRKILMIEDRKEDSKKSQFTTRLIAELRQDRSVRPAGRPLNCRADF